MDDIGKKPVPCSGGRNVHTPAAGWLGPGRARPVAVSRDEAVPRSAGAFARRQAWLQGNLLRHEKLAEFIRTQRPGTGAAVTAGGFQESARSVYAELESAPWILSVCDNA